MTLEGPAAGNYELKSAVFETEGDIDRRQVTVTGIKAISKEYDGDTKATLNYDSVTVDNVVKGETLTVAATGAFEKPNVGQGISVYIEADSITLGGTTVNNYVLSRSQPRLVTAASITPRTVTVSGLTVTEKTYDGTTAATLSGTATLGNVVGNDNVQVSTQGAAASFADKNAGAGKTVTVLGSGLTLTGDDAANYALPETLTLSGNITPKKAYITGVDAANKEYDGTTDATIIGTPTCNDFVAGDDVAIDATNAKAEFLDKDAGERSISVMFSGYALTGADKDNYSLQEFNYYVMAKISKKAVYVADVTAENKEYDGTTDAVVHMEGATLSGIVAGEENQVTLETGAAAAAFADAAVGTGKTVAVTGLSLSGDGASNYELQALEVKADILKKAISLTQVTAKNKPYDGTTEAALDFAQEIANARVGQEELELTGTGVFASADAGENIGVSFVSVSLSGKDKDNYVLAAGALNRKMAANITKADAPKADNGTLSIANGYAYTYRFDFSTLVPSLGTGKSYGTVAYGTPTVTLGNYYVSGAELDENGVLSLPIAKNQTDAEGSIGTVTVTVHSDNVADFTLTLDVSASNRKLPLGAPTLSRDYLTYGESLSAITLSGSMYYAEPTAARSGRVEVPGTFTWTAPTTKPNAGSFEAQWTFVPEDTVTYLSVNGTSAITVRKAQQSAPAAPEIDTVEQERITLKAIPDNANGAKAQYRMNDGAWQDSPVFDGLTAGDEYSFQARYGETDNYLASPESETTKETTKRYVLTFEVNGGSKLDSVEAKAGETVRLDSYKPTRSGYRFEGWYSDETLKTKVTSVTMDGDTTVYARWTVRNSVIPATGDDAPIVFCLTILTVSAAAIVALTTMSRKRKEREG